MKIRHTFTTLQTEAVERFVDWLTTLTVEREVGGARKAKIVLCGHRQVFDH